MSKEGVFRISEGMDFQRVGAVTLMALSPKNLQSGVGNGEQTLFRGPQIPGWGVGGGEGPAGTGEQGHGEIAVEEVFVCDALPTGFQ